MWKMVNILLHSLISDSVYNTVKLKSQSNKSFFDPTLLKEKDK